MKSTVAPRQFWITIWLPILATEKVLFSKYLCTMAFLDSKKFPAERVLLL
jgi:hypothetical protein